MLGVQRAPTKNLSQANRNDVIYLVGDGTEDDDRRFKYEVTEDFGHFQLKEDGVWNDTGFRFGSLILELDMTLSPIAGFLQTNNPSSVAGHVKGLIPHIEFDDTGTGQVQAPIISTEETFDVYTTEVSEEIGTSIGISLSVTPGRAITQSIHEVGNVAASDDVTVSFYVGTDNTGTKFDSRILPASDLAANTQLVIEYSNELGLRAGTDIFQEFTSDATISLKTDTNGDPLTSHTGREIGQLFITTENVYYDNDCNPMLDNSLNPHYMNQF